MRQRINRRRQIEYHLNVEGEDEDGLILNQCKEDKAEDALIIIGLLAALGQHTIWLLEVAMTHENTLSLPF